MITLWACMRVIRHSISITYMRLIQLTIAAYKRVIPLTIFSSDTAKSDTVHYIVYTRVILLTI